MRACVQDLGYDAQLESSRATYLFDVIDATGDEASFVEPVAMALLTAAEHWSTVQLFDVWQRCWRKRDTPSPATRCTAGSIGTMHQALSTVAKPWSNLMSCQDCSMSLIT